MSSEKVLDNCEAIVSDIEEIDRDLGGAARQASDREAFDIVSRIERRLLPMVPDRGRMDQQAQPVPADEDVF